MEITFAFSVPSKSWMCGLNAKTFPFRLYAMALAIHESGILIMKNLFIATLCKLQTTSKFSCKLH
jgi:hypothetical protein